MNEVLKDLVHTDVYDRVSLAGELYGKADRINTQMEELDKAELTLQERVINQWNIRVEVNHMSALQFSDKSELAPEILEAVKQLITLLEAIHYSERKAIIIEFNNSLKKADDGSSTEK